MRIRLIPLTLSLIATGVAVACAVALGATLMPIVAARLLRHPDAGLIGVWVAILGGAGVALMIARGQHGDAQKR